MRKAADHNFALAQYSLGSTFQYGPVTPNPAESRRWYGLAAQNKTAPASYRAMAAKALKEMDAPPQAEAEKAKDAKPLTKTDALLAAVESGDIAKVEALLAGGARVNSTGTEFGQTPLGVAASRDYMPMVQYLLAHGADVKLRDNYGGTALHTVGWDATIYSPPGGDPEIVRLLISKGADPNSKDNNGNTPLHELVRTGDSKHVEVANALLSADADVNARNENGETPLITLLKVEAGCSSMFKLAAALPNIDALMRAGTDLSIKDKDGNSALSLTQDIRKNCSSRGDSPEDLAASRSAVATLTRLMARGTAKK
jgi:ankyrin repeat protein